jgi:hypothetical protein
MLKEMKTLLKQQLEIEESLVEAYSSALMEIFGEKGEEAVNILEENIDFYDQTAFIPNVNYIKRAFSDIEKRKEEWNLKQEKKNKEENEK